MSGIQSSVVRFLILSIYTLAALPTRNKKTKYGKHKRKCGKAFQCLYLSISVCHDGQLWVGNPNAQASALSHKRM